MIKQLRTGLSAARWAYRRRSAGPEHRKPAVDLGDVTRSRYSRDFATSVSNVPMVAAMVSSAWSLKLSMESIVA